MADNLYLNIDCLFFNSIVNGHLRPFLPIYDSDDELKKLNSITLELTITDGQIKEWCTDNIMPKEIFEKFNVTADDIAEFYKESDNEITIRLSKPEDYLEPLIDLDIPPTLDNKCEAFLMLIEREFETMRNKAQLVLVSSNSEKQLALYANKNIQNLIDLAPQAKRLQKQLSSPNKNYLNDSNVYVLEILLVFIIRAILFFQELFQPFIKVAKGDYYNLRTELYGEVHPKELVKQLESKYKRLSYNNINDIFNYINGGILQLELYIKGNIKVILYHNISGAFVKLFSELIKIENFTRSNISLVEKYHSIFYDIIANNEDGEYAASIDLENKLFIRLINEVSTSMDLIETFLYKHNLITEEETQKHSILDILLKKEVDGSTSTNNEIIIPAVSNAGLKQIKKLIPVSFSYVRYNSNLSALTDMLVCLKKNKFIAEQTDIKEFRKIFNNKAPSKPLVWLGNVSELVYFVKLLNNDFSLISDLKRDIWKVTGKLFVDQNNNPFDWSIFRGQKTPAKAELLENAVKNLK